MGAPPARISYLDALKGIAVMSVVLAHSIALPHLVAHATPGSLPYENGFLQPEAFRSVIYNVIASLYLPLFAFVSGLVQGIKGPTVTWGVVRRRFGQLMVPYAAWTIVYSLAQPSTLTTDPKGWIQGVAVALIDPRSGALWFLYALFMSYMLVAAIGALTTRPWVLPASAVFMMFVLALPIPNILGVRDTASLYPFFVLGLVGMGRSVLRSRQAVWVSAVSYPLLLATIWPTVIDVQRWWVPPFRSLVHAAGVNSRVVLVWLPNLTIHFGKYLCAAAGSILIYNIYVRANETFLRPQAWVGRRSLGIYASHRLVIVTAIAAGIVKTAAVFALAAGGAIVVTLVLERIPGLANVFLGRPTTRAEPQTGRR